MLNKLTLNPTSADPFIKIPLEKLKTGGTEISRLEVRIFNSGRGIHDASPIPAMGEAHAVS
jgi:hypothetical protein